ncbi:MAG: hypothetical protein ACKPKO_40490, partial [Candidatus Fonsibacter sp.]
DSAETLRCNGKITQNTAGHSCTMTMTPKAITTKTSKRCAVLLDLTNDCLFAYGARKTVPCPFTTMGPIGEHLRPNRGLAQVLKKA